MNQHKTCMDAFELTFAKNKQKKGAIIEQTTDENFSLFDQSIKQLCTPALQLNWLCLVPLKILWKVSMSLIS